MRRSDGYLYTPGDDRSGVLLRALNQYIAENKVPYTAASMSLEDHFMEVEINSADEDDEDDPEKHTEIGYLKTYYRIRQKPPEEKWIEIEKDLEFHLAVENEKRPVDKDTAPQLRAVGQKGHCQDVCSKACDGILCFWRHQVKHPESMQRL